MDCDAIIILSGQRQYSSEFHRRPAGEGYTLEDVAKSTRFPFISHQSRLNNGV